MTGAWVAGSVRATAMGRRRLGRAGVRALAREPTLESAVASLSRTPYGHDVRIGDELLQAQHAVVDALLWHVRVLSGWLPPQGARAIRVLVSGLELSNLDELVRRLDGLAHEPAYRLGGLATSWPVLAEATSRPDLRDRLARTSWGDPGEPLGDVGWSAPLVLRLVWARRVVQTVPELREQATAAAALLLWREVVRPQRALPAAAASDATRLLGGAALRAASLDDYTRALPREVCWAVEGAADAEGLWRAELRWWDRLEEVCFALSRQRGFDRPQVIGAVGLLAVDAYRVRAALVLAAGPDTPELRDVLA